MIDLEKTVSGDKLRREDQLYVMRAYVHRFTRQHTPNWARGEWKDGKPYPVQFASDQEWLENTRFQVKPDGSLDHRVRECHSRPTWPDNPELR